jgi:hypothetical protein
MGLAVGLFFVLTIRPGHVWGDDFSMYIRQAMNLADGTSYQDTGYLYNPITSGVGPRTYPPVFPLLLAPIYPAINSAMLSALPQRQHAAMTGLIVVFSALGGTLGSFVTGRLFVAFDGTTAFGLLLVPVTALAISLARLRRHLAS